MQKVRVETTYRNKNNKNMVEGTIWNVCAGDRSSHSVRIANSGNPLRQGRINPRQGPKASSFCGPLDTANPRDFRALFLYNLRSEERRVGKEGRSRWSP